MTRLNEGTVEQWGSPSRCLLCGLTVMMNSSGRARVAAFFAVMLGLVGSI